MKDQLLEYYAARQQAEAQDQLISQTRDLFSDVTSARNTNRFKDMERLVKLMAEMKRKGERPAKRQPLTRLSDLRF